MCLSYNNVILKYYNFAELKKMYLKKYLVNEYVDNLH